MRSLILLFFLWFSFEAYATTVKSLNVDILSTNLADDGIGEWGFSALVRADGHCILFDTGNYPDTVLTNTAMLEVDLSCVTDVVLSHHHGDHTGGLRTLFNAQKQLYPNLEWRVHVAEGMFYSRPGNNQRERNPMLRNKESLEQAGIKFIEHSESAEIFPGVWVLGPTPRIHDEKNYSVNNTVLINGNEAVDNLPESQGLSIVTDKGHVVILGCGHAGIVNIVTHARKEIAEVPIHAVIGGFHLLNATTETVQWTAEKLLEADVENIIGAHCTGLQALYELRQFTGRPRSAVVVGAVGASFNLQRGIIPGALAR